MHETINKSITVQQLIEELLKIEDKSKEVAVVSDGYYSLVGKVTEGEYVFINDRNS